MVPRRRVVNQQRIVRLELSCRPMCIKFQSLTKSKRSNGASPNLIQFFLVLGQQTLKIWWGSDKPFLSYLVGLCAQKFKASPNRNGQIYPHQIWYSSSLSLGQQILKIWWRSVKPFLSYLVVYKITKSFEKSRLFNGFLPNLVQCFPAPRLTNPANLVVTRATVLELLLDNQNFKISPNRDGPMESHQIWYRASLPLGQQTLKIWWCYNFPFSSYSRYKI